MEIKILVVGIVKNGSQVLLRKKPEGSPPYAQTWYLFGGQLTGDNTPEQAIADIVKQQAGLEIAMMEMVGWDTEIKTDVDGVVRQFVYLDALCEYLAGEIVVGEGLEAVEWVELSQLDQYDHVPPSLKLLRRLGYIK